MGLVKRPVPESVRIFTWKWRILYSGAFWSNFWKFIMSVTMGSET